MPQQEPFPPYRHKVGGEAAINDAVARRRFLSSVTTGLAGIGLSQLMTSESVASDLPTGTHFPAKAKRVLQIFCPGAASHIDLWEHKPMLDNCLLYTSDAADE